MKKIILIMTLQIFVVSFSQSKNIDSLMELEKKVRKERDSFSQLDLLSIKYKYLNEKYLIKIDNEIFNDISKNYKREMKNYKDSLIIILSYELKSDAGAGIAFHRILYKWEKLGYYLWKTDYEAKVIGNSFGFEHPYRFYEYLMNNKINSKQKLALLNEVKLKVKTATNKDLNIVPYKTFLNEVFKLNPDRLKAMDAYIKENGKHKH